MLLLFSITLINVYFIYNFTLINCKKSIKIILIFKKENVKMSLDDFVDKFKKFLGTTVLVALSLYNLYSFSIAFPFLKINKSRKNYVAKLDSLFIAYQKEIVNDSTFMKFLKNSPDGDVSKDTTIVRHFYTPENKCPTKVQYIKAHFKLKLIDYFNSLHPRDKVYFFEPGDALSYRKKYDRYWKDEYYVLPHELNKLIESYINHLKTKKKN